VSQHIHTSPSGETKFVFGWDQPLMTFYLQVHDMTKSEDAEEDRVYAWYGSTVDNAMYEVEDLVRAAHRHGLIIEAPMMTQLYREKDEGV
jgi:hypothetical protein